MSVRAEYLRAPEIARHLGVSERSVRRWIASGEVPSVKIGGSRLVALEDLGKLLNADKPLPDNSEYNET